MAEERHVSRFYFEKKQKKGGKVVGMGLE